MFNFNNNQWASNDWLASQIPSLGSPMQIGSTSPITNTPWYSSKDFWLGGNNTPGIAQLGLGLLGGLGSTFMGMKQYGMAKKALKQSQDQFNKNYEAQKKLTNSSLEDRQNARIAASGGSGTYQNTADYMKRYGIE